MRHRAVTTTAIRMNRTRHRVQGFEFVDQGAEVGKAGNTFAFELVLPSNRLNDLANNLRQPTQRMCFVKRDRIGGGRQELTTLSDQRLQMKFNGLPVKQDDRTRIPRPLGVRLEIQGLDEGLSGSAKRSRVEGDFDVAAIVPGTVVLDYRPRFGK